MAPMNNSLTIGRVVIDMSEVSCKRKKIVSNRRSSSLGSPLRKVVADDENDSPERGVALVKVADRPAPLMKGGGGMSVATRRLAAF